MNYFIIDRFGNNCGYFETESAAAWYLYRNNMYLTHEIRKSWFSEN